MTIFDLLHTVVQYNASDLHLIVGSPPTVRIDGKLVVVQGWQPLTIETAQQLVLPLLVDKQREVFASNRELDFSYQFEQYGRFRVNVYYQKGGVSAALRLIPNTIRTFEELKLPSIFHNFINLRQGLILVTGPTGHGKSTTLAATIDAINSSRADHILTIEDPIEYLFTPKQSIISQRELESDTFSWEMALRSALREDPDVVLVGEMRDYETIAAAITVAETGHLVFATLHTNSAAQTVDRIIDVFPEHQQGQIRMQLSNVLQGVVAQRLVPAIGGGRLPVVEVMLSSPAIANIIREGKTHQLDNVIRTSSELGMITLEKHLAQRVDAREISMEVAQSYAFRPQELERAVNPSSGEGE